MRFDASRVSDLPNSTVTLMRYCRTDEGWKRLPAAIGKNGRIRPEYVLMHGKQVHCPAGHYELRFYEGRKLKYENVGDNPASAFTARQVKEKLLTAKTAAQDAGVTLVEVPGRKYLRRAANLYIQDRKDQGAMEAARDAQNVLDEFLASSGRTFLDEVTKDDIYAYQASLRKQGRTDRTVANKHNRLRSFLRFAGIDVKTIMPQKPKYEKSLPTIYGTEQITPLREAADDYMRLVIELGSQCGLRELEMVYLEWPDIHRKEKILRVQGKPFWGFKVKDSEQRDVPIPDELLERLAVWHEARDKEWREAHLKATKEAGKETRSRTRLVLGTKRDLPNMHLLRQLKRLVNRARLDCGICEGCSTDVKECQEWTLHKLRRTYATTLIRNGIDLRTVQAYMGHADLASTMRYLRPAETKETRTAINNIFSSPKVTHGKANRNRKARKDHAVSHLAAGETARTADGQRTGG
jgi:integrase